MLALTTYGLLPSPPAERYHGRGEIRWTMNSPDPPDRSRSFVTGQRKEDRKGDEKKAAAIVPNRPSMGKIVMMGLR